MRTISSIIFVWILTLPLQLQAQHNDVEFGYDDLSLPTGFLLEPLGFDRTTSDGIILVQSNMEELDPFAPGDFSADQPGFTTNNSKGLMVNSGDAIMINALDASLHSNFGVGYVNYYNPGSNSLEASGRIAFEDNTGSTPNLILNGSQIESGVNPQFIGLASSGGNVHDHITWDLLDDSSAPTGAYGILVQLQSDFSTLDGNIDLSSDPFWLVFNHGMSTEEFETMALPSFGISSVPEPACSTILLLVCGTVMVKRRRTKLI